MIVYFRDKQASLTNEEIDNNLRELSTTKMTVNSENISGNKYFELGYISKEGTPSGLQALRTSDVHSFINTVVGINISTTNNNLSLVFGKSPIRTSNILNVGDAITSQYVNDNLGKGITVSTSYPTNPDNNPPNDVWLVTSLNSPRTIIDISYYINGSWTNTGVN